MPLPLGESPSRSSSRPRRVPKTANVSRRDKVRQGRLIRCWTDEEETFLFRSRNQKLPYRHIANRLEKSELACRLHYHHMMVGRKGHRVDEVEDDVSDDGAATSPPNMPARVQTPTLPDSHAAVALEPRPATAAPQLCTLPSFDTFLRDTFHRRSVSMPDAVTGAGNMVLEGQRRKETYVPSSPRSVKTGSRTWLREDVRPPPPFPVRDASSPHGAGTTPYRIPLGRSPEIQYVEDSKTSYFKPVPSIQF
ncbi:hypothetical protein A1O3_04190 [Capronia epimyces CBS 606.96]|uniref:Uncharacterized protein n=1 Tax=Capronia epimyces CBS 606.96 TaxID=1182542 RepID=W9YD92_9EURO|nr:uncharacterized protein A1O3_04190 [Capronia epimyces CBS 606.96]EXJ87231.1 hypothetical protein A1O3_04190 [Capronia epimyces CBS 606.96]